MATNKPDHGEVESETTHIDDARNELCDDLRVEYGTHRGYSDHLTAGYIA